MKRCLAMLLAVMMLSLSACGGNDAGAAGENEVQIEDAVTLLTVIWDSYGEDEKFPAMGGDFSEENMTDGAPGVYGTGDASALDYSLGLPETSASMIDNAASLIHMMNANTFTCGAFHVSNSDDLSTVADSLRENIRQREWMCGFPDKLVVITVGDYVISAFGNEELIDLFKDKAMSAYETAELAYEEPIM